MTAKPTALSQWIAARQESTQATADYFETRGLVIARESVRRWRNGEPVGRQCLADVHRITKISLVELLGC